MKKNIDNNTITKIINKIHNTVIKKDCHRYFRGHSDSEFKLLPSVYRNGLIENESNIYRESILHVPDEFNGYQKCIEFLSKMQHYQIPTRLLDITSNPMVALYFACCENEEKDGELLGFDVPNKHVKYFDSDTVAVLSNISKMDSFFESPELNDTDLEEFNEINYSFLLHEIRQEKPYFLSKINPNHISSIVAVKAKFNNLRMQKQNAAFLLFGIDKFKNNPAILDSRWIVYKNDQKIIIKAQDKPKIVKNLEKIGISKRNLFPEIDYLGEFLNTNYAIKNLKK